MKHRPACSHTHALSQRRLQIAAEGGKFGRCSAGYEWILQGPNGDPRNGARCAGGSHTLSQQELKNQGILDKIDAKVREAVNKEKEKQLAKARADAEAEAQREMERLTAEYEAEKKRIEQIRQDRADERQKFQEEVDAMDAREWLLRETDWGKSAFKPSDEFEDRTVMVALTDTQLQKSRAPDRGFLTIRGVDKIRFRKGDQIEVLGAPQAVDEDFRKVEVKWDVALRAGPGCFIPPDTARKEIAAVIEEATTAKPVPSPLPEPHDDAGWERAEAAFPPPCSVLSEVESLIEIKCMQRFREDVQNVVRVVYISGGDDGDAEHSVRTTIMTDEEVEKKKEEVADDVIASEGGKFERCVQGYEWVLQGPDGDPPNGARCKGGSHTLTHEELVEKGIGGKLEAKVAEVVANRKQHYYQALALPSGEYLGTQPNGDGRPAEHKMFQKLYGHVLALPSRRIFVQTDVIGCGNVNGGFFNAMSMLSVSPRARAADYVKAAEGPKLAACLRRAGKSIIECTGWMMMQIAIRRDSGADEVVLVPVMLHEADYDWGFQGLEDRDGFTGHAYFTPSDALVDELRGDFAGRASLALESLAATPIDRSKVDWTLKELSSGGDRRGLGDDTAQFELDAFDLHHQIFYDRVRWWCAFWAPFLSSFHKRGPSGRYWEPESGPANLEQSFQRLEALHGRVHTELSSSLSGFEDHAQGCTPEEVLFVAQEMHDLCSAAFDLDATWASEGYKSPAGAKLLTMCAHNTAATLRKRMQDWYKRRRAERREREIEEFKQNSDGVPDALAGANTGRQVDADGIEVHYFKVDDLGGLDSANRNFETQQSPSGRRASAEDAGDPSTPLTVKEFLRKKSSLDVNSPVHPLKLVEEEERRKKAAFEAEQAAAEEVRRRAVADHKAKMAAKKKAEEETAARWLAGEAQRAANARQAELEKQAAKKPPSVLGRWGRTEEPDERYSKPGWQSRVLTFRRPAKKEEPAEKPKRAWWRGGNSKPKKYAPSAASTWSATQKTSRRAGWSPSKRAHDANPKQTPLPPKPSAVAVADADLDVDLNMFVSQTQREPARANVTPSQRFANRKAMFEGFGDVDV